ncbi:MAG TPA: hypothetical protein VFF94_03005, partial [Novosphingobium sp.]|nr:hypothetical protein [Novosphingobium sp.]
MNRLRSRLAALLRMFMLLGCLLPAHVPAHAAGIPVSDEAQGDRFLSAFYVWQGEIPAQPGQLLRSEPLPRAAAQSQASLNIRILYTSTDGVTGRNRIVVSGAVFLPRGK